MSLKIVFMGTPAFALPSLDLLLRHPCTLAAVVTAPDKPRGRGRPVTASPVKDFAVRHGIPVLQPEPLNDPSFVRFLSDLHPDLIVVVAFRILPPEVFRLPRLGSFNLHASLLPKYRGAAPIQRAILNGETVTGVTTFLLQEQVDTGSILVQEQIGIGPDETAGEVRERLAVLGAAAVLRTVTLLESGSVHPVPQADREATPAPKILKSDCWIDWSRPSRDIHNLVRALSPAPGAMTKHGQVLLKIFRTGVPGAGETPDSGWEELPPGCIAFSDKDRVLVRTGDGLLAIGEIQQEGRKRMKIGEFVRGFHLLRGDGLSRERTD